MTEQNNGWISTKEKLPENDDFALIVVLDSTLKIRFIEIAWLTRKSNGRTYFENLMSEFDLDIVTHWKPLPQLPKED